MSEWGKRIWEMTNADFEYLCYSVTVILFCTIIVGVSTCVVAGNTREMRQELKRIADAQCEGIKAD